MHGKRWSRRDVLRGSSALAAGMLFAEPVRAAPPSPASVTPELIEAARSFGLKGFDLIWNVVLPGAMPSFLLGLRFALAVSWLILVVAEEINASAGLGYLIMDARDFLRTDIIVVCLVIYAFLGLAADAVVRQIEARALAWRPKFITT